MVLCLDYGVLTLNHATNVLFQPVLINSEGLLAPNILDPFGIFGK
jgi:hypothetical protein